MKQTIADITKRLSQADEEEFAVLERALTSDPRKGIQQALERTRRRLDAQAEEASRVDSLYRFQQQMAAAAYRQVRGQDPSGDSWICAVGLDEVGRGPLAGPLTVGAVVLPENPQLLGINDSKQLTSARRTELSSRIQEAAIAWDIEHIPPAQIDALGMSACLHTAFSAAVHAVDVQIAARSETSPVQAVLLDGNPLHIDKREISIVHGDARVAAISAASIIAKVARDALMAAYDQQYPGYGFASNKGYGSAEHIAAIKRQGLCPIHRATFCRNFYQARLF
ncbi:MAG: ribonuclease HII [Eggerthellaceae bacterium]